MAERRTSLGSLLSSRLARDAAIYTVSQMVAKAIPFLLLPVLTRYLTPADYGVVAMFMLVTTVVEPFIALGLAGSVSVKYFDKKVDLPGYIGSGFAVSIIAAAPVALLLLLLRGPIGEATAVPPDWLVLVVALVLFRLLASVAMALWRVQQQPVRFGLFQNLQSAAVIGASLVLVVALGRHWQGRLEAELLAFGASALGALAWLRAAGWLRLGLVGEHARAMLRFGVPLIPHTLGAVLMVQTDRMFLTNMVGVDETGLYTVGYQLAQVIELVAVAFSNAYGPWLFRKLTDADAETRLRLVRYTYLQFAAMALFALAVGVGMPLFAELFLDEKFTRSATYVRWFAVAFGCSGLYYMVANYIFYAQRTGALALVTFGTALVNIPLTYLLIRANGGVGAAQATAASMALSFLLTWWMSARVHPMPWGAPFRRA